MSSQEVRMLSSTWAKRAAGGVVVILLGLFLVKNIWFRGAADPNHVVSDADDALSAGSLTATMIWETLEGETAEQTFPTIEIERIDGVGFWIAFEAAEENCYPGICVDGQFERLGTPLSEIGTLSLRLEAGTATGTIVRECHILDRTHEMAHRVVHPANVHHVLLLTNFVDAETPATALDPASLPHPEWAGPFERTHRLAMDYARQSDSQTREYENLCRVSARYDEPRLIVTSEELIETEFTSTVGQESDIAEGVTIPFVLIPPGDSSMQMEKIQTGPPTLNVRSGWESTRSHRRNGRPSWTRIPASIVV